MENSIQQEIKWLLDEKYEGKRTQEAEKDIAALRRGEHVDYVIGWVNFLGCKIDLSQRPLIPRPETEYWVERAIQEMKDKREVHGLDIFAGSGCIGIAILKHITLATIDFAEKEEKFCKQIAISAGINEIDPKRFRVITSDFFSNVGGRYDFILANPPYVAEDKREDVQQSVLVNEPAEAVFGGNDGLLHIKTFLQEAQKHLEVEGVIYLEFDSAQKQEIEEIANELGYEKSEFFKDQYEKWRFARIVL